MTEKLTESITFKCTYEEKRDLEAIARSEKLTLSEHVRSLGISNISTVRERINNLASLMRLTTDTVDTPIFELTTEPLPKPQATKKAQLCDQLSLICHTNELI
ncbi:hypothetical protein [Acinetobacter sp. WCHAc060025]|uniref:hypothetical protein n=1 Tax=Acinetobacter sp. WCHAc060025 TaxID=2518625 RepID=UPI001023B86F|nr:hypothetical protein [Acinetobacter sp. WCHAc060025]RZG72436.1 hypothetical protein EXE09_17100 [Acinetobacter sp. WCHAc060025]